MVDERLT